MDRALFEDEYLIVFVTICCFSVFNFEFYFSSFAQRIDPLYVL